MQPKPRAAIRPVNLEAFPEELKARPGYLLWRYEWRKGDWTKVPFNARNGKPAYWSNSREWSRFPQAVNAYKRGDWDGIGLIISAGSGYAGVDLDHCVEGGVISPDVMRMILAINSYTELSPSGTGVRIFCRGSLPEGGRKRGNVEMYDSGRWLSVTGRHIAGTPLTVEERTAQLRAVHQQVWPEELRPAAPLVGGKTVLSDQEALQLALQARNGAEFGRLYVGDWSDYHSRSEAHLALCSKLAFWCRNDQAQVDRLFRGSGLYSEQDQARRWDTVHSANGDTYGQMTVERACQRREIYDPARYAMFNTAPGRKSTYARA